MPGAVGVIGRGSGFDSGSIRLSCHGAGWVEVDNHLLAQILMNIKSDDKGKSTYRRLLLSKNIYLHGLGHSRANSPLDKMIAIHNFHNALEIVLRSIFLHHEIRPEKQLNIDFESMLNEIDSHEKFRQNNIKLPYRQELRNLNQVRNMVQHHAVEPEASTIDDWRVFTNRFLIKAFKTYFNEDFDELTSTNFIECDGLKRLLLIGYELQEKHQYLESVIAAKLAFIYASYSIQRFLPSDGLNSDFFVISSISSELRRLDLRLSGKVEDIIRKIYDKISESQRYSAIISSGVSFYDYKRYEELTPSITLTLSGSYVVQMGPNFNPDSESSSWVLSFVEQAIIKWQLAGIKLEFKDHLLMSCNNAIEELTKKTRNE